MSKKKNTPVSTVKSAALIKGELTVPEDQQESLRALDAAGADIQKNYGAFLMDFEAKKNQFLIAYQKNRDEFRKAIETIAKENGVDFDKVQEPWTFDLKSMTYRRANPPTRQG